MSMLHHDLKKFVDILKKDLSFSFYRYPRTFYKIFSRYEHILDEVILGCDNYPALCPKDFPIDLGSVIVEYGCNAGEQSLNYLNFYKPKMLISIDISQTAIDLCLLLKEKLKISHWDFIKSDLIKEETLVMRDYTIIHDPFTYDDFEFTEKEYITRCKCMIESALSQTFVGGGIIIYDHGEDVFDYGKEFCCETSQIDSKKLIVIRKEKF